MIPALITTLIPAIKNVLDKIIPDKDTARRAKEQLDKSALAGELKEFELAASVVLAEVQGESKIQREWRPHLMYLIMFLLVFNGVIVPLLMMFGLSVPTLEAWKSIPEELWTVLMIGVGGYIGGRSVEKTAKSISQSLVKNGTGNGTGK